MFRVSASRGLLLNSLGGIASGRVSGRVLSWGVRVSNYRTRSSPTRNNIHVYENKNRTRIGFGVAPTKLCSPLDVGLHTNGQVNNFMPTAVSSYISLFVSIPVSLFFFF